MINNALNPNKGNVYKISRSGAALLGEVARVLRDKFGIVVKQANHVSLQNNCKGKVAAF